VDRRSRLVVRGGQTSGLLNLWGNEDVAIKKGGHMEC